ncbi:aspartate/glutamate racemase family protein [Pseudactinotalea sp.]|uniref:aspartate/glutamate racemase family protein n=1 Tax=Pseudactinotalea sp. TaxID=1926260 RepID=UPI003B3A746A
MRTVGLIGGMSWYSTLEYYRVINEGVQRARGGHASAPIALQSLDFAEIRECQLAGDWERAGAILAQAGQRCESAGAETVLICTNLMHKAAPAVERSIGVPLLHIGDAIADRADHEGWHTLGVLGTRWVMEEDFYTGRLRERGLDALVPQECDRIEADRVIFDELTQGVVTEASRRRFVDMITGLHESGADAVVLGCTEIELLVRPGDVDVPLLDSMRAHAEAAVTVVLADSAALSA